MTAEGCRCYWSWGWLKMTSLARSLRRLRPAFIWIGDVVAETPHHLQRASHIHSSSHRVFNRAQTNLLKNHSFTISTRAISVHAAKLMNGGSPRLFFFSVFGLNFFVLDWIWLQNFSLPLFICIQICCFQLQKQTEQGLLLSMNEELLVVNL